MPELPEVETARRRAERRPCGVGASRRSPWSATPIVYDGRRARALRRRPAWPPRPRGPPQGQAPLDGARPPALAALPLRHDGLLRDLPRRRPRGRGSGRSSSRWRTGRGWRCPTRAASDASASRSAPRTSTRSRASASTCWRACRPRARSIGALLARRGGPVKSVLLDQSLFAGVGNWIADEALYQARIDPRRAASSLGAGGGGAAARAAARDRAARRRGRARTTAASLAPGSSTHRWGREAGARTARGERVLHLTIGGRTTAFVPSRQR